MLAENKLGQYLVYALGEIVLVMIGILLALQVNNSNESRKEYLIEEQLVGLLISDLEEKRKENQTDLQDAFRFIENFQPSLNSWEENKTIDTTNLKRNLRILGYDFYYLNEKSPLYATLSSTNLWKDMPDSLTKQIEDVYRIRLQSVKVVLDKTAEHGTYCKLHFLVPNNLIDLNQSIEEVQERVSRVGEEYISYTKLFMNNCRLLKGRLKRSETGITEVIENLESYIESKK